MTERTQPALGDLAVGMVGPSLVVQDIGRTDFVKYAGASGDFNPNHHSDPHARSAGNRSVFAQGMLTGGYAARFVTDWFGVASVRTFDLRFEARVWPGDTLTITGKVVNLDEHYGKVGATFAATNQCDEVVLTGSTTVVLDP